MAVEIRQSLKLNAFEEGNQDGLQNGTNSSPVYGKENGFACFGSKVEL
jgi:hypothetical protein